MAHVWVEDDLTNGWAVASLDGTDQWQLLKTGRLAAGEHSLGDPERAPATLARYCDGNSEVWVLLLSTSCDVGVNGRPLHSGLRVLADRDEILVLDHESGVRHRCFFSTERLANVEPFAAPDGSVVCPRCKDPTEKNQPAVQCPGCGVWHHEIEGERNCWTYAPRCSQCGWPTDLHGHYRWSPEEL